MDDRTLRTLLFLCVGLMFVLPCLANDANRVPSESVINSPQHPRILQASNQRTNRPAQAILPAPASTDFDGMERTLAGYQRAYETMSLKELFAVWPDIDPRREAALREVFKFLSKTPSTPRLDLECTAPSVVNTTVNIQCKQALTWQEDRKPKTVGPVRVGILLKKQADDWVIQSIKGL